MQSIREAAAVILLRPSSLPGTGARSGFELLLVRRKRAASFMGSACVFPGGVIEDCDKGDMRFTAARELFEESGILIKRRDCTPELRATLSPNNGAAAIDHIDAFALEFWSHWTTPSIEPKRYSTKFYLAVLPPDEHAAVDHNEAVEHFWVNPSEALVRARELALPPPQVRMCWELSRIPTIGHAFAAARGREAVNVMPRRLPGPELCLLMPWDPEYQSAGEGEAAPFSQRPSWAFGRSRFIYRDGSWHQVDAPVGISAG